MGIPVFFASHIPGQRFALGETAPLLAWPDEGARACGEQGANREARAPGIGIKKKSCRSSSFRLVNFGRFIPPKMQFSIGSL